MPCFLLILTLADFDNLTNGQKNLLSQIDLSGVACSTIPKGRSFDEGQTAFVLGVIRTALCHGNINFSLPTKTADVKYNFDDAVVNFMSQGKGENSPKVTVSCTVKTLHKIMNNSAFYSSRRKIIESYNNSLIGEDPHKAVDELSKMLLELGIKPEDIESFTPSKKQPGEEE